MDEKKLQRRLPCCRIGTIRAPAPLPVQRSGQYTAGYPAYLLQAQVQRSPLLVSSSTLERGGGALPMNRACYNSDAEGGREESTHARGRCFPPRPASGLYKARNRATQANNGRALMGLIMTANASGGCVGSAFAGVTPVSFDNLSLRRTSILESLRVTVCGASAETTYWEKRRVQIGRCSYC